MALPHQSIATINAPEFINLQPLDINPLMSKCEIKVLYIGENRNRSYITKEVATEMSKSLRGAPIVGYYKKDKQDFADHGEQMIWDDQGIHFNTLTKPYGFVAPDAKVWFQKFEDTDEFQNTFEREYLMTTGFLWTGQFAEAQQVLEEGKPQSMELDEETLNGHWATNIKDNMEFFIINDAIFTKLCILGDDVEPCFEGASVTKPELSSNFSYSVDDKFRKTLFQMMNDLQDALRGGKYMEKNFELEQNVQFSDSVDETALETSDSQSDTTFNLEENEPVAEDTFAKKQDQQKEEESDDTKETSDDEKDTDDTNEEEDTTNDKDDEEEENKKKYSLLLEKYEALNEQYSQLKKDYDSLVEFKEQVENERKDALIADFYMLSEQDKKEVIQNKAKYSLEEIKAKLAIICFEKKVNFDSNDSIKNDNNIEQNIMTFNYDNNDDANLPDWVKAVKQIDNN